MEEVEKSLQAQIDAFQAKVDALMAEVKATSAKIKKCRVALNALKGIEISPKGGTKTRVGSNRYRVEQFILQSPVAVKAGDVISGLSMQSNSTSVRTSINALFCEGKIHRAPFHGRAYVYGDKFVIEQYLSQAPTPS
jgi:hypothetical protein